jgi:hypothetical protein
MRILLDEGVPVGMAMQLSGHDVHTAPELGWAGTKNGALIAAAEAAGFEVMVTGDKNIVYQNNLSGRRIAVVALSTNHWPTLQAHPNLIGAAVAGTGQGAYVTVKYPRPRLRRRSHPTLEA